MQPKWIKREAELLLGLGLVRDRFSALQNEAEKTESHCTEFVGGQTSYESWISPLSTPVAIARLLLDVRHVLCFHAIGARKFA